MTAGCTEITYRAIKQTCCDKIMTTPYLSHNSKRHTHLGLLHNEVQLSELYTYVHVMHDLTS